MTGRRKLLLEKPFFSCALKKCLYLQEGMTFCGLDIWYQLIYHKTQYKQSKKGDDREALKASACC